MLARKKKDLISLDFSLVSESSPPPPSVNASVGDISSVTSCISPTKWLRTTTNHIMLKLNHVSVVCSISLAKFNKAQIANMKDFKVYGGLNPSCSHELLHSGFYADDRQEVFPLRHHIGTGSNAVILPIQYIKIVPLGGRTSPINYWFVELRGECEADVVQPAVKAYQQYKEHEVFRLCLKHARQLKMQATFDALLLSKPNAPLWEHPIITEIFNSLVIHGDFAKTEELLTKSHESNYFDEYMSAYPYTPHWSRIYPAKGELSPGMRGGHQMCIDEAAGQIFLFGGWDGGKDLGDLWVYHISKGKWELISADVERDGGPGPRSCHKICFDEKNRRIYTLGRYVEASEAAPASRSSPFSTFSPSQLFASLQPTMSQLIHAAILPNPHLSSLHHLNSQNTPSSSSTLSAERAPDFFYYEVDTRKWVKLSSDTQKEGGPSTIFDHQMVLDPASQLIYVFGGKEITENKEIEGSYSGLYQYDVANNKWTLLRDEEELGPKLSRPTELRSRTGHSMLFDPLRKMLYIFAGQRNKNYLSDFFEYNIEGDDVTELTRDSHRAGGPQGGFTQRATFDPTLGEIYVLSGVVREMMPNVDHNVRNSFWVYNVGKRRWSKVFQNENSNQQFWQPRYAHQLVYDSVNKVHYMFGGNPGDGEGKQRLDDFWSLTLSRPSKDFMPNRLKFLVRKQQFNELCASAAPKFDTLMFLRTTVASTVSQEDKYTLSLFNSLPLSLFDGLGIEQENDVSTQRYRLFEEILGYFPAAMCPPSSNLTDFVD